MDDLPSWPVVGAEIEVLHHHGDERVRMDADDGPIRADSSALRHDAVATAFRCGDCAELVTVVIDVRYESGRDGARRT